MCLKVLEEEEEDEVFDEINELPQVSLKQSIREKKQPTGNISGSTSIERLWRTLDWTENFDAVSAKNTGAGLGDDTWWWYSCFPLFFSRQFYDHWLGRKYQKLSHCTSSFIIDDDKYCQKNKKHIVRLGETLLTRNLCWIRTSRGRVQISWRAWGNALVFW